MSVKISEIPGLLIEKKIEGKHDGHENDDRSWCYQCSESGEWEEFTNNWLYNQAIDTQGAVEITLEREKLAIELHRQEKIIFGFGYEWENERNTVKHQFRQVADALIKSLPQLLVAVKK